MKKIIAIFAAVALTATVANAQTQKGEMVATLGYSPVGGALNYTSMPSELTHIRPITLGLDYGVMNFGKMVLGLGVQLSEELITYSVSAAGITSKLNYNSLIPAARVSLHYPLLSNIEVNGGVTLGYNIVSLSTKLNGTEMMPQDQRSNGEFAWAPYVGVKVYLLGGLGIYADFGFGNIAKKDYNFGATTQATSAKKSDIFLNLGLAYKF